MPGWRDEVRLDFGVRKLLPEWRGFFKLEHLRADLVAGVTVACIAVPLSLAIALASGVEPAVGLTTAIFAGIVCALFGGTPLAVSGPAAAMAILIASVVEKHGMSGLLVVGLGCGLLQLLTGVCGFGKLARYVPVPVVAGFTAGIGAIILIGQLPRAMGLSPPDQSHVFDVITHLNEEISQAQPLAVVLAASAVLICIFLPKLTMRVPAPLVAVVLPTLAVTIFGLPVPTIGEIPRSLPPPALPTLPSLDALWPLLSAIVMVYVLASLETLLSSSAVDKLSESERHDPDQELIGQGLGNTIVALFGGIPVTGVIARSALNVQSGGKTRRAAIFHALTLLAIVLVLAPAIGRIPLACLAGVLLAVALRMMNVREFWLLWRTSRPEGLVYAITFLVIVLVDLIAGIQVGLIAAFVILAIRLSQNRIHQLTREHGQVRVALQGPLTFLSPRALEPVRRAIEEDGSTQELVIDLSRVTTLDITGAELLGTLIEQLRGRHTRVALMGLDRRLERILRGADVDGHISSLLARSERDVDRLLHSDQGERPIDRLVRGVEHFRADGLQRYHVLFESLAEGQQPHTLFITCSDSRIQPNLITSTDPGELFIVRNVGNIIPPFDSDGLPGEGAAVEYAAGILDVEEVVICGHSSCGAIQALLSSPLPELPSLRKWLAHATPVRRLDEPISLEAAAQLNTLIQVQHLTTYPIIKERLAAGTLRLHPWYFDIGSGELYEWNDKAAAFVPLTSARAHSLVAGPGIEQ